MSDAIRAHVGEVHGDCKVHGCMVCRGGLFVCTICNCAEGTLPTECPGVRVPPRVQTLIFKGVVNYRGGAWVSARRRANRIILVAASDSP